MLSARWPSAICDRGRLSECSPPVPAEPRAPRIGEMTTIAFCYICFEGNRTLKDLLKSEEECLELMAKLRVCVSEVDWSLNKNLLVCDRCIKKLNKAHEFKKQCIQSSETLKLYLSELKKTKDKQVEKKEEPLVLQYLNLIKDDKSLKKLPPIVTKTSTPEQTTTTFPAITKIILTQQPNSFPNVFLNIIPQSKNIDDKTPMLNLSNVIQLTQTPPPLIITKLKSECVVKEEGGGELSKLLTEVKTEEVSVEIDPLDISLEQQVNNFRPILPKSENEKSQQDYDYTNEEKMEFFNSGHFLLQDIEKTNKFYCDKCLIRFESAVTLHKHMMSIHMAQYPYKCDYCGAEFASKSMHKQHVNNHCDEMSELLTDSITLTDFTTNNPKINDIIMPPEPADDELKLNADIKAEQVTEVKCDECDRVFISYQGLIRHKAKVHKSYQRKKYFIKGMKNAKCDICNRMFSTQSYLNLHRKLHERKGVWRRKIYKPECNAEENHEMDNSEVEMEEEEGEVVAEPESVSKGKLLLMDQDVEVIPCNADTNNTSAKDETPPPPNKCPYCSEQTEDLKTLQRHIDKTHLKTTQYKCQYCEDAFKLGIHLVKHLSIHTNATCGTCNQIFANTNHLKSHITASHNGKCRQKGRCGLCDKTFEHINELEGHIDEHISVYKCHLCSKQFKECLELTRHLMEHNTSRRKTIQLTDEIDAIPIHQ